ncbi:putative Asparagine synthetase [Magnetospirillum sp. XM-1]|uniref:asparagine synthase (glutamine-hydrolyzing) n=1 Tax=Magnetospirillum sp. XM-1 TaxID=1663591 RepID=UPI00073DCDB9|nr:asparagine synthase (glutamine-hydrolyzing) [Magnetospirillum sp. XM-1]CUW38079.1 putative Asparagine synthetase [Magnetospirillum sp. XM-1]
MCGIVGVYHFEGRPVEGSRVAAMIRAVAHRGPDGDGIWTEGSMALGHCRLAIRGLGTDGAQPMADPAGRAVISYNGEIYNDAPLRQAIRRETGYEFRTACDTETLLAGWLAWGEELFGRLDGMFAVAIWDRRRNTLALARDGAGIKPLYRQCHAGGFAFASEIKGLLPALDAVPAFSPAALNRFFAHGYAGPETSLLEGVEQIAPGTVEVWDGRDWVARRFWQPTRHSQIHRLDEAVAAFTDLWPSTVSGMLVSEVPVGVLQSGGIDSSLITAVTGHSADVPAFVASFTEGSHDETPMASLVARQVGAGLTPVPVDVDEGAEATFRAMVHHLDGQLSDSSAFALYRLCAEIRRHVTVALSGDGADEFFAGYPTYGASRLARWLRPAVPRGLAARLGASLAHLGGADERRLPPVAVLSRFLLGLAAPEPHCEWRRLIPDVQLDEIRGPALAGEAAADPSAGYAAAMGEDGPIMDRCLLADQRYYLPADMLVKVDRMSMAHGLEIRVPFLSTAIMDLAGRMDAGILYSGLGQGKRPLRRALAGMGLPPEVTEGRKKGFNLPIDRMLRQSLAPLCRTLLDERAENLAPWLRPDSVRRLWRQHRDRERSLGYGLWPILTFAAWKETLSHVR